MRISWNLRVTANLRPASVIMNVENSMYFGPPNSVKERTARRERQDLVLLSQEMEARHQQLLRLAETSRGKLKMTLPVASPAS
jgi:hypothetical protein